MRPERDWILPAAVLAMGLGVFSSGWRLGSLIPISAGLLLGLVIRGTAKQRSRELAQARSDLLEYAGVEATGMGAFNLRSPEDQVRFREILELGEQPQLSSRRVELGHHVIVAKGHDLKDLWVLYPKRVDRERISKVAASRIARVERHAGDRRVGSYMTIEGSNGDRANLYLAGGHVAKELFN